MPQTFSVDTFPQADFTDFTLCGRVSVLVTSVWSGLFAMHVRCICALITPDRQALCADAERVARS